MKSVPSDLYVNVKSHIQQALIVQNHFLTINKHKTAVKLTQDHFIVTLHTVDHPYSMLLSIFIPCNSPQVTAGIAKRSERRFGFSLE